MHLNGSRLNFKKRKYSAAGAVITTKFDVTPLMGRTYQARDNDGSTYYFSVCDGVTDLPAACNNIYSASGSNGNFPITAVQYRNGVCTVLGRDTTPVWQLIDENDPSVGVELYYWKGDECRPGKPRELRFQFFCEDAAGDGSSGQHVVEFKNMCRYSIIWPTQYACPNRGSTTTVSYSPHIANAVRSVRGLSGGWKFIIILMILFSTYIAMGVLYNVSYLRLKFGIEAIPHVTFWRQLPELVLDGINFAKSKVSQLTGGSQREGYESVNTQF